MQIKDVYRIIETLFNYYYADGKNSYEKFIQIIIYKSKKYFEYMHLEFDIDNLNYDEMMCYYDCRDIIDNYNFKLKYEEFQIINESLENNKQKVKEHMLSYKNEYDDDTLIKYLSLSFIKMGILYNIDETKKIEIKYE